MSTHASKNVTCLDCHQPAAGQEKTDHHSFVISKSVTSANCRSCHESVYQQYLPAGMQPRHGRPCMVRGGLTAEQVAYSEKFHPGASKRAANALVELEGMAAMPAAGQVPRHRQAERRWNRGNVHGLPYATYVVGSNRSAADDVRAMSHGTGSFAARNLQRIEAWADVSRRSRTCSIFPRSQNT